MVHHGHSVWIWSAPTLQLSHSALKPIPSLFLFRQMSTSVTSGLLLLTGLSCCTLCYVRDRVPPPNTENDWQAGLRLRQEEKKKPSMQMENIEASKIIKLIFIYCMINWFIIVTCLLLYQIFVFFKYVKVFFLLITWPNPWTFHVVSLSEPDIRAPKLENCPKRSHWAF